MPRPRSPGSSIVRSRSRCFQRWTGPGARAHGRARFRRSGGTSWRHSQRGSGRRTRDKSLHKGCQPRQSAPRVKRRLTRRPRLSRFARATPGNPRPCGCRDRTADTVRARVASHRCGPARAPRDSRGGRRRGTVPARRWPRRRLAGNRRAPPALRSVRRFRPGLRTWRAHPLS